ncbi:MAG: thermonuclease family protein [Pseudomonadota bacterium]
MGEHFKPNNVVHGRFGRPGGRGWLSPDYYDALSAKEKRELWARRTHERQFRPMQPRYRKGHYARQRLIWAAFVFGGIGLFQLVDSMPMFRSPGELASSVAPTITGGFSACKWGGGTNCVVDGDTIYLNGDKIRIAGIDAPETHDYGCPSELGLGERAASRLQALLNSGGAVTLTSIDRDEDVYGRKLRNVAVGGADVGDTLIGEGLARAYGGGRRSWCG